MKCFKAQNPMALSLSSFYAPWAFFGANISLSKNALTDLYYNFSYETLSGGRDFTFEAISDLTTDMSLNMKHSTLLNLRKSEHDQKSNNDIKNSHFFKKAGHDDKFENELKKDLFKELEHVKTDNFYVEPIVQDAETVEKETKKIG